MPLAPHAAARRPSRAFATAAVLAFVAAIAAAAGCGRTDLAEDLLTPGQGVDGGVDGGCPGCAPDAPGLPDGTVGRPDVTRPPPHMDATRPPVDSHMEDRFRLVDDHRIDVPVNDTGTCGNGQCIDGETCKSCPEDCGFCMGCGDGTCDDGETCSNCPADCGACDSCGDGFCDDGETCTTCPQDCGQCASCGDGKCESNENCNNCPQDCGKCAGCPSGDCSGTETCISCPQDCGSCAYCGNGTCDDGETCDTCPQDCGTCVQAQTCAAILACAMTGIEAAISSGNYGNALTALSDCDANACTQAQMMSAQAVDCLIMQFLPPGMCGFGGGSGGGFTCALSACAIQVEECESQAPCPGSG